MDAVKASFDTHEPAARVEPDANRIRLAVISPQDTLHLVTLFRSFYDVGNYCPRQQCHLPLVFNRRITCTTYCSNNDSLQHDHCYRERRFADTTTLTTVSEATRASRRRGCVGDLKSRTSTSLTRKGIVQAIHAISEALKVELMRWT